MAGWAKAAGVGMLPSPDHSGMTPGTRHAIHGGLDDAAVGLVTGLRRDRGEKLSGCHRHVLSQNEARVSSTRASHLHCRKRLLLLNQGVADLGQQLFRLAGGGRRRRRFRLLHAVRDLDELEQDEGEIRKLMSDGDEAP